MPRRLENCAILSANISMEYEKAEVNTGFFYSNAAQREKMVAAERAITDDRVQKARHSAIARVALDAGLAFMLSIEAWRCGSVGLTWFAVCVAHDC